ncbi:MAG: diaminohydroxyphosphoribosylaminopyrimidine deaminase [Flavobacteriales bacterium]|jgi:diaminohydroxyphosphoribosylaminopyrimidine deaminase/5-amino-6-(5-phosphoribosylamino)uracil reductase
MVTFSPLDHQMMSRALRIARKGTNTCTPNPIVGCVLVAASGDVIAEGFHQRAGEAHAEAAAIQTAAAQSISLSGATAYVTLEPCSHTGRTGPCCDALIEAGVSKLVYGMEDPNPNVSGRGLQKLKEAGIEIVGPFMEDSARELNPGFLKRMQTGIPFIRIKSAMSIDARTAMKSGESKWITSPKAREDVQRLRARSCAVITGVSSVIHDDPALTVRLSDEDRQPLRVILDSKGRCPIKAEMFSQPGRTIIVSCIEWEVPEGAELWVLPEHNDRVKLSALMERLAQEGCNEVLVETGATLAGAFVGAGLVDQFIIYMAPKFLGSDARPLFELPIKTMSGSLPLIIKDIRPVGCDWRICAEPDPDS